MKRISFRSVRPSSFFLAAAGKYLALFAAMALLSFALPQNEPVAFALFFAAVCRGLDPFLCGAGYLLSSVPALSFAATLSFAVQAAPLLLISVLYRRFGKKIGWERVAYAAAGQLPFLFLFPHRGYALFPFAVIWQKCILALFFLALCLLFDGALRALLTRAFRSRLTAGELAQIGLLWLFTGLGLLGSLGEIAFYAVTAFLLLSAVALIKNAAAVPFSVVLSLPLCVAEVSAVPLALYAAAACLCLLLIPYGRIASSIALFVFFGAVCFFEGLYARGALEIVLTLAAVLLPAVAVCCIPEKTRKKLEKSLLFYRERTLPRIAVNRNRRAVGEQLYEVSALFREIEDAFRLQERPDPCADRLRERLTESLCRACPNNRRCREARIDEAMDKLIAVGKAKGRVNLIDLPSEISSLCNNSAGMLFALNKQLGDYRRYAAEMDAAREGRRLLAEQAHGVSEILRDIALEQSEEFTLSDAERALSSALAAEGMLSSEIFVYGEGPSLTVSMTLDERTDAKKICRAAGAALGVPLALSEKIPLSAGSACFVLRRKANFDAAFGVASRPKQGEEASGDTHSILRIDERRFLVALSDGMGSGEEARDVSDRTLSLLECFYKAKMPSETVLSTVNRLIAFSAEETFSCLDLAAVNLDTGAADIVKIGSPVGFLISGEELRVLEGESLPIGMLEAVHPATMRVEMKENDFLLFMSDGVTTAFGSVAELCSYLSGLHPLNPQSFSEEILKNALERYDGKAEDDMTVVAVKLTKAA